MGFPNVHTIISLDQINTGSTVRMMLAYAIIEEGYRFSLDLHLSEDAYDRAKVDLNLVPTAYSEDNAGTEYFTIYDKYKMYWQKPNDLIGNRWYVTILAKSLESIEEVKPLLEAYKEDKEIEENEAKVAFWYMGKNGAKRYSRPIASSFWDEIKTNYTAKLSTELDYLMTMESPKEGGKLIVWHGAPGTGKSHAIRSLMLRWASWCRTSYIADTEKFFGDAAYLMEVVMSEDDSESGGYLMQRGYSFNKTSKYHLIVIEDADELITTDAKERTGQSLTRLLNITDGLLGQGLNTLFLITTNQRMEDINPAIIRPGRAMANIEFLPLTVGEANAWLANRNQKVTVSKSTSLAELYSMAQSTQVVTNKGKKGKMGF